MKQIASFLKQLAAIVAIAAVSSQIFAAQAKNVPRYEIAAGSVVCFGEDSYNDQMAFFAQGINRTLADCGVASKPIPVVVIDLNMFSASKVRAVDGGMTLWVGIESIEERK